MNILKSLILTDTYITQKIQKEKTKMNDKRIEKTIPVIALLLSLALTACGTQDFQPLTRVEQTAPAIGTQEAEAATETVADTESPLAQRETLEWEQRLDYNSDEAIAVGGDGEDVGWTDEVM